MIGLCGLGVRTEMALLLWRRRLGRDLEGQLEALVTGLARLGSLFPMD